MVDWLERRSFATFCPDDPGISLATMARCGRNRRATSTALAASGGNPLGGLLGRIGTVSMTTLVQSVETGTLSDDLFAPPAGDKLNLKK